MEEIPIPESISTKEEILKKLKLEGLTPENKELIGKWFEGRRIKEKSASETVQTNIDLSDLYVAIGDFNEAESCLSEAIYQAQQEYDETGDETNYKLYVLAQSKIIKLDEIRSK